MLSRSILLIFAVTSTGLAMSAGHAEPSAPPIAKTIELLKVDLATRQSTAATDIETVSVAAVVWRDTSLGCGKPDESYAQVDTEGYEVVLAHAGRRFDYRVRKDGTFLLCELPVRG